MKVTFFRTPTRIVATGFSKEALTPDDINRLCWLFGNATPCNENALSGTFVGPRREMITPWSTNAVEITQNMGIEGIARIEEFFQSQEAEPAHDPMLQRVYKGLDASIFDITRTPEPIVYITDIAAYNDKEGLALSAEEIEYLNEVAERIGRKLSDSEVFGFSQVNSEHCRHKIFNGRFVIDGQDMGDSLFALIKKTSKTHPNLIVSAYSDNVAFVQGPDVEQFAPKSQHQPDFFEISDIHTVLSLKAETHNFPTTVEPFNGAATGSGGEIRDRMAGGKASIPLAGTAVYMTSYTRSHEGRPWEQHTPPRQWLYQSPEDILIKASNGASDFGNKFGQPLICGSVLTFEHHEGETWLGYDKVIMLAGGVGFARSEDAQKDLPQPGDVIVVLGGDNYRIGMGGGAVSSVDTGKFASSIELNAVQRSNPEMQKRVYNAIRAMSESGTNPVVSIHDHGAGGHLNSLSELVEATGGIIDMNLLPVGDPTLSAKEIIGNESQERMGLIMKTKDIDMLRQIARRERAPMYEVGHATGDSVLSFVQGEKKPIDLKLEYLFGKPPRMVISDRTRQVAYRSANLSPEQIQLWLEGVLQMEAVACKDYLTNKVDRSVTGKVALQQCAGEIQLPLNNLGVMALDYQGKAGIATSIGHAPVSGLIDAAAGSVLAIAEALTNLVWAPLTHGLKGVSLSANWMWPCKNEGEDARLYQAVKAASDFAIALGINIPTGKDSLSMTQKYPDKTVKAPGTVIISAAAQVNDVKRLVKPVAKTIDGSTLYYIPFTSPEFEIGGSSFAQLIGVVGQTAPQVGSADYFIRCFEAVQQLINDQIVLAGHDVSAGGIITTLLEMNFANTGFGMDIDFCDFAAVNVVNLLFAEIPGVVIQVSDNQKVESVLKGAHVSGYAIGRVVSERTLRVRCGDWQHSFAIDSLRDIWYRTSWLLDRRQCGTDLAATRFANYKSQPLAFSYPSDFTGSFAQSGIEPSRRKPSGIRAAIIREKGVNGDREMAWVMHLAGFDVKDVHMTDLISGRETLEDVSFIVFVGGFSNSDVLGSAKGWAGAFLYNARANEALRNFYARPDTLSLGVCNGCQLMVELGLITADHADKPVMLHNESHKFESSFLTVDLHDSPSVMLTGLEGSRLGIWVAHGEGRFSFPHSADRYHIPMTYGYAAYPANPNGSDYNAAAICSADGRHLAMMPHLERAFYPWQCAWYPEERRADEITPWVKAFVNARKWLENK